MRRLPILALVSMALLFVVSGQSCGVPPLNTPPNDIEPGCSNSCTFALDGVCDDGGAGSSYDLCDYGTDCADCGQRAGWIPPEPPPTSPEPPLVPRFGTTIVAFDGQFLGTINDNAFDSDSVANNFGDFGSQFSNTSIWNNFGTYGGEFGSLSAFNDFTTTPPRIFGNGIFVAYLTTNQLLVPRVDPNNLAVLVGRPEEQR